jgi:branched-chain amino acid transport system permease protein
MFAMMGITVCLTLPKDPKAKILGINNRIVFAIGSALAAVGGIMWAMKYPRLEPLMGIMPGLKCFIAAVIGGIGSIAGAVLGGLLLGIIELMTIAFLPEFTGYKDAFAFVLLIVVLLVKPTGLLGKNQGEKV